MDDNVDVEKRNLNGNTLKSRDKKVRDAVQNFFELEGDMHELQHVIQDAIDSMPINVLGFTTKLLSVLRAQQLFHIGDIRAMSQEELAAMPGVGRGMARVLHDALSIFGRSHVRLAENTAPDCRAESCLARDTADA